MNCYYAWFKLELKKRQCLFSSTVWELVSPYRDSLIVEVPVQVTPFTLQDGTVSKALPVELMLVKRKEMKNTYTNLPYLKGFVAPIEVASLPCKGDNELLVLGESKEATDQVLDNQMCDAIRNLTRIEQLHITDQKTYGAT